MSRTIKPTGDRVLIRLIAEEQRMGMWLPEVVVSAPRDGSRRGLVVALGDGVLIKKGRRKGQRRPFNVTIGDTVMFKSTHMDDVDLRMRNQDHVMLAEDRVLCIVGGGS